MTFDRLIHRVGIATSVYFLTLLGQHVYTYCRPSSISRYIEGGKETWALVTGASDGIGFGFAQELCQLGVNVLLHGRNREKLAAAKERLRHEFPRVQCEIVSFDAAGPTESLDEFVAEVQKFNVRILINNVGGQGGLVSPEFKLLHEYRHDEVEMVVGLNARFATQLTRLLIPVLIANGPSLVLNISGLSAIGMPFISIHSAAKGYVDSLTKSLHAEMKVANAPVEVIGINVGNVNSNANSSAVGFFTPSARNMAKAALGRVGCGRMLLAGYWPHSLQFMLLGLLPETVLQRAMTSAMTAMKNRAELQEKQNQ